MADITELLNKWHAGGREAFDELVPHVYGEIRTSAAYLLLGERPGHLLETSALVREAYLRLSGKRGSGAVYEPLDLARVVELRYVGGLTLDETAEVLEVSPQAVSRDWTVACAWLSRRLGDASAPGPPGPPR